MVKRSANWAEAEKDCNIKGGHLASIHSAAENNFIESLCSDCNLWIGGKDTAVGVGFTIYLHMYLINSRVPQLRVVLKRRFRTWLI